MSDTDKDWQDICSICYEPLDGQLDTTNCNHTFHTECLEHWIGHDLDLLEDDYDDQVRPPKNCPSCRQNIVIKPQCPRLPEFDEILEMLYHGDVATSPAFQKATYIKMRGPKKDWATWMLMKGRPQNSRILRLVIIPPGGSFAVVRFCYNKSPTVSVEEAVKTCRFIQRYLKFSLYHCNFAQIQEADFAWWPGQKFGLNRWRRAKQQNMQVLRMVQDKNFFHCMHGHFFHLGNDGAWLRRRDRGDMVEAILSKLRKLPLFDCTWQIATARLDGHPNIPIPATEAQLSDCQVINYEDWIRRETDSEEPLGSEAEVVHDATDTLP